MFDALYLNLWKNSKLTFQTSQLHRSNLMHQPIGDRPPSYEVHARNCLSKKQERNPKLDRLRRLWVLVDIFVQNFKQKEENM